MAIKVVSEGPVQTRRHVCENCHEVHVMPREVA